MTIFLKTAVGIERFDQTHSLGSGAKRQPLGKPAQLKMEQALSKTLDQFYPSIDESSHDAARGEKGVIRYRTRQGEPVAVTYHGNSKDGSYTEEVPGGSYLHAEFTPQAVDTLTVTSQGVRHTHLDRIHPNHSYVETEQGAWNIYGPLPSFPSEPPKVSPDKLVTKPDGLRYAVLQPGHGPAVAAGQEVLVHYTGWLTDGKKFDSSLDRKQPFEFRLGAGQVIRGWDEGVEGMKVGEKRLLLIPAKLAYGKRGAGSTIPPNSSLVFEVQLEDAGKP